MLLGGAKSPTNTNSKGEAARDRLVVNTRWKAGAPTTHGPTHAPIDKVSTKDGKGTSNVSGAPGRIDVGPVIKIFTASRVVLLGSNVKEPVRVRVPDGFVNVAVASDNVYSIGVAVAGVDVTKSGAETTIAPRRPSLRDRSGIPAFDRPVMFIASISRLWRMNSRKNYSLSCNINKFGLNQPTFPGFPVVVRAGGPPDLLGQQ
jgi:hypothetical protein